jgi:hypothetical protein
MRIAQRQASIQVEVSLWAVGYEEDEPVMPDGFQRLPPLTRSVLDVAKFQKQRKLPLLKDVLDRVYDGCEADFLIYTNVDIGLQPDFYLTVREFIEHGFDGFVINRRTISNSYSRPEDLPLIWAERGDAHRGWDCFVFRREFYQQFILGDICIGAPRIGLALLSNLIAATHRFYEFKEEYLTFHLGDDRSLKDSTFRAYADHNTRELDILLKRLEDRNGRFPLNTPAGAYLFKRRTFGPLYETWTKRVYLPAKWSQSLNRLLGKLPGTD